MFHFIDRLLFDVLGVSVEASKPLPEKYRFLLFDDKREVELVWNGKTNEVTNVVLPFQVIEQVDEPRAEKPEDMALQPGRFDERGRQLKGWTNKLIWGDNTHSRMNSLPTCSVGNPQLFPSPLYTHKCPAFPRSEFLDPPRFFFVFFFHDQVFCHFPSSVAHCLREATECQLV